MFALAGASNNDQACRIGRAVVEMIAINRLDAVSLITVRHAAPSYSQGDGIA